MHGAYIAKLANNKLYSFYYTAENGISLRINENKRWGRPISLVLDAQEYFTVNLGSDGKFYIFYLDREGSVRLCTNNINNRQSAAPHVPGRDQSFTTRPIMDKSDINGKYYHAVVSGKGINLIYESKNEEGADCIVSQKLEGGTRWSGKETIDRHYPGNNGGLNLQAVSDDHALLFYQTRRPDAHVGYRELNMEKTGTFNTFHISSNPIAGSSYLTTTECIHFLYTVKTMFSYQLIYRRRHGDGLTAAVVVSEAARIDNCLLFIVNNRIYACFMNNNHPYICTSDDDGATFSRPQRYRSKFCDTPAKAAFIFQDPLKENEFCAREVYVDSLNPWDVQILPDLYDDFYPAASAYPASAQAPAQGQNPDLNSRPQSQRGGATSDNYVGTAENQPSEAEMYYGADLPIEAKLKNQLDMARRQAADKDRQIHLLQNEIQTQKAVIERLFREKEEAKSAGKKQSTALVRTDELEQK